MRASREANIPESVMTNLPASSYCKCLDDLAAPSWLVDTFRHHLNPDLWPPSDKAEGQPIGTGSSRKRAREKGELELRILWAKNQRLSDGSGSYSGSRVPSDDEQSD